MKSNEDDAKKKDPSMGFDRIAAIARGEPDPDPPETWAIIGHDQLVSRDLARDVAWAMLDTDGREARKIIDGVEHRWNRRAIAWNEVAEGDRVIEPPKAF